MKHENSTACKLLATKCICCGRALVDSVSVELGIGPECRHGFNEGIPTNVREEANKLVFEASIAATQGKISVVREKAEMIRKLGLENLADTICFRFSKAEEKSDIKISFDGKFYVVITPYRRKDSKEFVSAWRNIPGRVWKDGANLVPMESKKELWRVLVQFFGGKFGQGPKGIFRIPVQTGIPVQGSLNLK